MSIAGMICMVRKAAENGGSAAARGERRKMTWGEAGRR